MNICPLCKNKSELVYENKEMSYGINIYSSKIDIEVSICSECKFVFQSSAYSSFYDEMIKKLYASYDISNMYNFPNRNYAHLKALEFIEPYIENKINFNILEIGSNRGDFLFLLKEKFPIINVLGCEPTSFKELIVPTVNAFFEKDLFNTKFDLVIIRHTLEHIKYPENFIKQVSSILHKNSKIFIEVPNLKYSLEHYVEDFTPDHVNFFYKETLGNLFSSFETLKIKETEYLYGLYQLSNKKNKSKDIIDENFNEKFERYNKHLDNLLIKVLMYKRIIFYGISNFYVWTYDKLVKRIENQELLFMDDYLVKDNINNLQKIDSFKRGDIVILCSSNIHTQNKMLKNLPNNISVLLPWEKINHV